MNIFGISIDSLLPWKMASRIRMLTFVLGKIGSGDFSQKAPISENDLLGKLGTRINEIADSLALQIDKLKNEQVQLETIISNMSEGVVVMDESGTIALANPAWYKIFGTSPKSLGHNVLESARIPQIYDMITRVIRTNSPSEDEFGVGEKFFIARSVPFESERKKGCVTVVNDITKIKRLETIRRDFTANVSHQMKTPLTSILGYSETLLNGALEDPASAKQFVQTIHSQSLKLKELIDEVLKLAQIESEMHSQDTKKTEISGLLERLISEFRGNKKNITLSFAGSRTEITTDTTALEHIIRNLLDNAIKYTPPDGDVTVSMKNEQNNVLISVEDTGIGINPNELDRVFERFYRNESTVVEGHGLGLAIAKHLANRIGARIQVQSEVGKGSKFLVVLPPTL